MKHDAAITELLVKPSLEGLAYLLRHKELWPFGFGWNYTKEANCAIGLTRVMWPNNHRRIGQYNWDWIKETYKLNAFHADRLFFVDMANRSVTAENVATRIDRYLEKVRS